MKNNEAYKMPTAVRCHTCKEFAVDMTCAGEPMTFVGECRHHNRMTEADDCCLSHDFAEWAKRKWQEAYE